VSTTIGSVIRLSIMLPICLAIHLPVLLPIHLSIMLSVSLAVLLPVRLPILLSVCLPICLPVRLAILLTDIRLRKYHIWEAGWGSHSHDQAGNRSSFHQILLHDAYSFCLREWVISERRGCCWMAPLRLSHLVARSNQPVTK
jgi:hypothetical protein